jgi:hypothetical protein
VQFQFELAPGSTIAGRIKNLRVPGAWPLSPDKTLTLRWGTSKGPLPPVRLRVVRCDRQGDRWALRCQLLQPVAAELLRALGQPPAKG